jgi:integrase
MTGEFFPKSISDQKANDYIKEAAGQVEELKKGIIYNTTIEGVRKSIIMPKYDLITNHTSRRSFATNAILQGYSRDVVMSLTGHKTEKSFNRYLRMDERDLAKLYKLQSKKIELQ